MGKFNKTWFKQIMISTSLKQDLNCLKFIIAKEMNVNWKLSYNDEIKFLIKKFNESRRIEVQLEPALLMGNLLNNPGLKISKKLDGKTRVAYSLES